MRTSLNSHFSLVVHATTCLIACCHGSFLGTGPPAAPRPQQMGVDIELTGLINGIIQNRTAQREAQGNYTENSAHVYQVPPEDEHAPYGNLTGTTNSRYSAANLSISSKLAPPSYWFLTDQKFKNQQPFAGNNYPVFRNVMSPPYNAKADGKTDDWEAIMRAVTDGRTCGQGCAATSTKGSVVYFPPGDYLISKPIIQYYYSSFVGHPVRRPRIMPTKNFEGIALIDTDAYVENGNGENWWVNQNNFYRQIRNFILDIRSLKNRVNKGVEGGAPAALHWQVSQACTLQNIHFEMPEGDDVTHRGIFMENGSGGFVSDLTFNGGAVGFVAGSQQYTARNLRFTNCKVAIEMLWDWGFNWKDIRVDNCKVGINASRSGIAGALAQRQSTGSLTVIDSSFMKVGTLLILAQFRGYQPNVVLDNVRIDEVKSGVMEGGKEIYSGGSKTIVSWIVGHAYTDQYPKGQVVYGEMDGPRKDPSLLDSNGRFFARDKPQYEKLSSSDFLNVLDYGVSNHGILLRNNVYAINRALQDSARLGKVLVFPAGIYQVDDTIIIPKGARLVGILWPQIMACGPAFEHLVKLKVLAKVGNEGEKGSVEISDMLFTSKGPTAGCIFMEWNLKEEKQGSAAMWETIFRVGGAKGTDLDISTCHQYGNQDLQRCMASSMMLHVTRSASIYLENMWLWVADHDIDNQAQTRLNVYGGRGVLIESQGPSWISSVSNEHSTLYNWQLSEAKNIYLAQIQSETPYFQAGQLESYYPYDPYYDFPNDPEFPDCNGTLSNGFDTCEESWALRIIGSRNIYLYGGGFYSFFTGYDDTCAKMEGVCQEKLIDTDYSQNVWMYNLYTVAGQEVVSPQGLPAVQRDGVKNGFATAVAAWLMLANQGEKIGGTRWTASSSLSHSTEEFDPNSVPATCDWNLSFRNLDDLAKQTGSFSTFCAAVYTLGVYKTMISETMTKYSKENKGFDEVFKFFEKEFRESAISRLNEYMHPENPGKGSKFFSCKAVNSDKWIKCTDAYVSATASEVDYRLDDKSGFEADLLKSTSLLGAWIDFGNSNYLGSKPEAKPMMNSTFHEPYIVTGSADVNHKCHHCPVMKKDYPVPDPRKVIGSITGGVEALLNNIVATSLDLKTGFWPDSAGAAVDLFTLPVLILDEAVSGMGEIKSLVSKQKAEEKKEKILMIISIVFMAVPFVGQAGAALAGLSRLAIIFGDLGIVANAGLGVYNIGEHPEMAPLELIGIALGGKLRGVRGTNGLGGLEDAATKMAALGRTMKLSARSTRNRDTADLIMNACRR